MTKFIPKLNDISTQFSGSDATELQPTPGSETQLGKQELNPESTKADAIAIRDSDPVSDTPSNSPSKPTSKLVAGIKRLTESAFDLKNPLYRSCKFWILTGLGIGVSGSAIAIGVTWWNLDRSLPDPVGVLTFVRDGTLTIKAEDGTILQQRGEATREKLTLEEMPPLLVQAFVASEDRRFYQHQGVDYQGVGRALVSNILARDVVEGGSTITQQLARIAFLSQERTVWRKIREMMLAQKMEQRLSKQQIMERYLNLVYLGEGAYGVTDAAWVYFSKPLEELTLAEIATLVGLAPSPNKFSPLVDGKAALQRRNLVLDRMTEAGFITPVQAKIASAEPMEVDPAPPKRLATEAPYFTSYIEQELPRFIPPEAVEAGGLIVETSLNREWQKKAEEVVEKAISRYGRGQRFKQAALVSIDPRNGEVKAMVGGTDFDDTQFNRVTQAMRQPGSTFKGFVYATAIAAGFSPYRGYLDAPFTVDGYTPKNYSESHSGWLSIRDALIKSVNTVAVRTLIDVGFDPVIDLSHKMGIKSELKPVYSLALGGVEVNLLELTNAYGTFATKGMHAEAHGIRRVLDQRGQVLYEAKFQPQQAVDEDTSAIMNWMLRGVVNSGTGGPASLPDRQVAGKTGTSDEARDLWFIGYIPQLVTGVWLGNDDNTPTWGSSGTAALTWRNFMSKAVEGMPVEKFPPRPDKVEGRKGIIKADPIRPGRLYVRRIKETDTNDDSSRIRRRRAPETDSAPAQVFRRRSRFRSEPQAVNNNAPTPAPRRRRRIWVSNSADTSASETPRVQRRRRSWASTPSETRSSETPRVQPRRRRTWASSNTSQSEAPRPQRRVRSERRRSFSSEQPVTRRSSRRASQGSSRRQSAPAARSQAPAPATQSAPAIEFKNHH